VICNRFVGNDWGNWEKNMNAYKGYTGQITSVDEIRGTFHGNIVGIQDVVTFQGATVKELVQAFHDSVDDYLAFCEERGESPEKPPSTLSAERAALVEIAFYKQMQNDNGIRYGILIEGEGAWKHFDPGSGIDPALLWYVRVELEGDGLTEDPQAARQLFITYTKPIRMLLGDLIAALREETDPMVWPVTTRQIEVASGLKLKVACSPVRRIPVRAVLPSVIDLRDRWQEHLDTLELVTPVSAG
jgi:hypothetical protein